MAVGLILLLWVFDGPNEGQIGRYFYCSRITARIIEMNKSNSVANWYRYIPNLKFVVWYI